MEKELTQLRFDKLGKKVGGEEGERKERGEETMLWRRKLEVIEREREDPILIHLRPSWREKTVNFLFFIFHPF